MMLRHPWLPAALPNRALTGTNLLAYLDRGLAALAPTDLPGPAKMEVLALLTGFVASYVTNELAGPDESPERVDELRAAVASGAYPHLAAVMAGSGGPAPPPGFDRIATRLIAGLIPTPSGDR